MPNIVITEGLDTPWELKNTESNITAATDLESINLANQVVGTLAYTSSQLFGSLKTEKDNLDKIVDAIELINEEIALYPQRVAAWDSVKTRTISDNVLGKMRVPLVKNDFVGINFPNPLAIQDGASLLDTGLKYANPGAFTYPPEDYDNSKIVFNADRSKLDALIELTAIKPSLDTANIQISSNQIGYLFPTPVETQSSYLETNYWRMTNSIIEGGTDASVAGTHDQLVVYRGADGKPTSYKYFYMTYEDVQNTSTPFGGTIRQYTLKNVEVPSDRLLTFAVPKDRLELDAWRLTLNYPQKLIDATNTLLNNTGLPAGVTPPVTTLGPGVEKYYDSALYSMTEYIRDGSSVIPTPNSQIIMQGIYPPELRADLDLSKMTRADVGKYFQKPGIDTIYYIAAIRDDGSVLVREGLATDKYISKMTDDIKKALRGEYAEKQILLTQRSTDQTLFVTSITQRYTTFSDMATNLLKTLMNFYNDLARNLRG